MKCWNKTVREVFIRANVLVVVDELQGKGDQTTEGDRWSKLILVCQSLMNLGDALASLDPILIGVARHGLANVAQVSAQLHVGARELLGDLGGLSMSGGVIGEAIGVILAHQLSVGVFDLLKRRAIGDA